MANESADSSAVSGAPAIGPPSDPVDAVVDSYYDTGAYLADPTRPGATIEPPTDCTEHRRCHICGTALPPNHRHHSVWADGTHRRGVCERCAD